MFGAVGTAVILRVCSGKLGIAIFETLGNIGGFGIRGIFYVFAI